ncbi:hypothetical protein [Streptomyces sp. 7N604]|uniref:hypothetical protein n=1 Tax=Streptomyces sp. 7N604 TaxID=3457415 RepID=UPI003FD256D7
MSSRLRTRAGAAARPGTRPASRLGPFLAAVLAAAVASAVLIALAAQWRFNDTSSSDSTPPTAADMTARTERVSEGLRRGPLYTDPESPDPFTAAERSALRDRIERLDVPVYVAAVPSWPDDESAGDSLLFAQRLHDETRRDGLYVVADPLDGDIELVNYGARLDTASLQAVPDAITSPGYDDPSDDLKLAERLGKLVSYIAKAPAGPAGSPPYEPPAAPDPIAEDTLPGLFSGDFVPGVVLGAFGALALGGLTVPVLWGVRQYLIGRAATRTRGGVRLRKGAEEPATPYGKLLRRAAGAVAGVAGLVLVTLVATVPEGFGLGSSPALFEAISDQDRALEAIIVGWYLLTVPIAGLLQTPVARYRRARIGTGWALIAAYWAVGLLVAVGAWYAEGAFPAHGGSGKSGGLFGAALALILGVPATYACSGAVFLRPRAPRQAEGAGPGAGLGAGPRPGLGELVRGQLTMVALGVFGFCGVFGGMVSAALTIPREGALAMFWPGAAWGGALGAALALALCGVAERGGGEARAERRRALLGNAARLARIGGLIFAVALGIAQLGWFLPPLAIGLGAIPAVVATLVLLAKYTRARSWFSFTLPDPPKAPSD